MPQDEIEVLSAVEAVRARPEMYVRPLADPLLPNWLLQEGACAALDDWAAGACHRVTVELFADGRASIDDDGPGWPLDRKGDRPPLAEVLMTVLNACRDHKKHPEIGTAVCKNGVVVLNALSEWCHLWIYQAGAVWHQSYTRGCPDAPFAAAGTATRTGTRLEFQLDAAILPHREYRAAELFAWLRDRAPCLDVRLTDHRNGMQYGRGELEPT